MHTVNRTSLRTSKLPERADVILTLTCAPDALPLASITTRPSGTIGCCASPRPASPASGATTTLAASASNGAPPPGSPGACQRQRRPRREMAGTWAARAAPFCSLPSGGGFCGIAGWTPSMASQCAAAAMSQTQRGEASPKPRSATASVARRSPYNSTLPTHRYTSARAGLAAAAL